MHHQGAIVIMVNCPGISWGVEAHINLFRTSIGWIAAYYDNEHAAPEIIRVFTPKNVVEYREMMKLMDFYNYNTCALCPLTRAALDWG